MKHLKLVFDEVRLVDASVATQLELLDGGQLRRTPYSCYAVWNKTKRCENCISAKVLTEHSRVTKFEQNGETIYHVTAIYVEVEGKPAVIEMISRLPEQGIFIPGCVNDYNNRMYLDPLTGSRNRSFYEERVKSMELVDALMILDVDDFKNINDKFGHQTGDSALKAIVKAVFSCVRRTDTVVRYGGDEFVIVFSNVPEDVFAEKQNAIREKVKSTRLESCPEAVLSVSIGGAYGPGPAERLLAEADRRMYEAKTEKNRIQATGVC
ncbi:MAG: GGDEF domain-containing protein [Candidatus Heteroscillospira sp.]